MSKPNQFSRWNPPTAEFKAAVVARYAATLKGPQVAREFGVSPHTVLLWARAAGVSTDKTQPARFWTHVDRKGDDECWLWTGNYLRGPSLKYGRGGYGLVTYDKRSQPAHRVAWKLTFGEIPEGIQVLHKCDVRKCCNPKHLFLGTNDDNMRDRDAKCRQLRGSEHKAAKFTEAQVAGMLRDYASGMTQADIMRKYGASRPNVCLIVNRKIWKHVRPDGSIEQPEDRQE